jgi:hypothetical protein
MAITVITGKKAFSVNCLIKERIDHMRKFWICLILICILLCSCTDGLKDAEISYAIKVTGSEKQKFSGHYSFVGIGGVPKPVSIDSVVPAEYKGKGIAAVCVFRKATKEGSLKVEILKDGKVVSTSETEQPFGVVSLGKVPDTNSIINKILGMILR